MRRHRKKSLKYGLGSGLVAFLGGWAAITFLIPETPFDQVARWKGLIWVYLGTHFVRISDIHTGESGFNTVQPVTLTNAPEIVFIIPIVAIGIAALYTCYQFKSSKIKHNISNAISAGMGYFLIVMTAIVMTDARPSVSVILTLALLVAGGLWLGSTFLSSFSRGVPFIGVTSFGTLAAVGVLLLLGGLAVLRAMYGVFVLSFGASALVGLAVGINRRIKQLGNHRNARFPRLHGLKRWGREYWMELLVTVMVLGALFVGLFQQTILF